MVWSSLIQQNLSCTFLLIFHCLLCLIAQTETRNNWERTVQLGSQRRRDWYGHTELRSVSCSRKVWFFRPYILLFASHLSILVSHMLGLWQNFCKFEFSLNQGERYSASNIFSSCIWNLTLSFQIRHLVSFCLRSPRHKEH